LVLIYNNLTRSNKIATKQRKAGKNMSSKEYKEMLIKNILEWQTREQFTQEDLQKKSVRALEIIHDNVD